MDFDTKKAFADPRDAEKFTSPHQISDENRIQANKLLAESRFLADLAAKHRNMRDQLDVLSDRCYDEARAKQAQAQQLLLPQSTRI